MNTGKSIEQIVREAAETGESYGQYVARTEILRLQAHYAEAKIGAKRQRAVRAKAAHEPEAPALAQHNRQRVTPEFKAMILHKIEDGQTAPAVSDKYGVPLNTIRKWISDAKRAAGIPPRPGNFRRGSNRVPAETKAQVMHSVLDDGAKPKEAAAKYHVDVKTVYRWLAAEADAEDEGED